MNDSEETAYGQGYRQALSGILSTCLRELGYEDTEATRCEWVIERESTVSALRNICRDWGDNDWDDDLSLADVVEKHLRRNLGEPSSADTDDDTTRISVEMWELLSQLLKVTRNFISDDDPCDFYDLKKAVNALDGVDAANEHVQEKLVVFNEQITRQYADLKKLYDVRMEVTQEVVRVKNEEISDLKFNVHELEEKIRGLENK